MELGKPTPNVNRNGTSPESRDEAKSRKVGVGGGLGVPDETVVVMKSL